MTKNKKNKNKQKKACRGFKFLSQTFFRPPTPTSSVPLAPRSLAPPKSSPPQVSPFRYVKHPPRASGRDSGRVRLERRHPLREHCDLEETSHSIDSFPPLPPHPELALTENALRRPPIPNQFPIPPRCSMRFVVLFLALFAAVASARPGKSS